MLSGPDAKSSITWWYVSADANFSERVRPEVKKMSDYSGSEDGFPSAGYNNLFQLHLGVLSASLYLAIFW